MVPRWARLARHVFGHLYGDRGATVGVTHPRRRGRPAAGRRLARLLRAAVAECPTEARLIAFDLLQADGQDQRPLPLEE